ncbi:MAG: hypothetical protein IKD79_05695 [Oscillospiraceae bacterium]|nr:hypothetical protein [Oscillospiraceae bacterium]
MKRWICLAICAVLLLALAACGGKEAAPAESAAPAQSQAPAETPAPQEQTLTEWTRSGYFSDKDENMLSITWMDDTDETGWYVGCMLGEDFVEDSWGGILPLEGNALRGTLPTFGEKDALTVAVTEEGADGLLLTVEGGGTYHFTPMDLPEATIFVTVNTEGMGGMIEYAEGETAPVIDPETPYQSAQINLAEPATYTFAAAAEKGSVFVKWTKNGQDYSTEPVITVQLDETADFVAVFEEDADWQNPVMNFVGEYQCGRARATVECFGAEEAWIAVEWGDSAWELARWDIFGKPDPETGFLAYEDCTKSIVTYNDDGDVADQVSEYENGTGTITFNADGTFTWHEDQSVSGEDMTFEPIPTPEDGAE